MKAMSYNESCKYNNKHSLRKHHYKGYCNCQNNTRRQQLTKNISIMDESKFAISVNIAICPKFNCFKEEIQAQKIYANIIYTYTSIP